MSTITHSALSEEQLSQVAYLFADDAFGTDASAYLYEVDRRGDVVSRQLTVDGGRSSTTRRVTLMTVTGRPSLQVSDEQIKIARMHMESLAASVAEKLYQQQIQEVTHHE
jgi:hypothetical protein